MASCWPLAGRMPARCNCLPTWPAHRREGLDSIGRRRDLGRQPPQTLSPWSVYAAIGRRVMTSRVPFATYRLQLTKDFGFDDAAVARTLPQGARHHASLRVAVPESAARQHARLRHRRSRASSIPSSAATKALRAMTAALKAHGIGLILDFVPNHMGVGHADNAWWLDVLEWGQRSPHADVFRYRLECAAAPPASRPAVADPRLALR